MSTERELKLKELEKLKEEQFVLWMKDRWSDDDYWLNRELERKIDELERELN